jgi:hypothetical protein
MESPIGKKLRFKDLDSLDPYEVVYIYVKFGEWHGYGYVEKVDKFGTVLRIEQGQMYRVVEESFDDERVIVWRLK